MIWPGADGKRASAALEEFRRQELRDFDHQAQWPLIDALLAAGFPVRGERGDRPATGLIEMQRLFLKARQKGLAKEIEGRTTL